MEFDNIISYSVNIVFLLPLFLYFKNKDIKLLKIFIIGLLLVLSNNSIKQIFIKVFPKCNILHRPQGAFNCDYLNRGGNESGNPGFPSGHVTAATYVMTSLYLYYKTNIELSMVYVLLISFARLNKRCHNIYQVIGGMMYGYSIAILFN
jgi:membrane-associated phospholipid phosphatase